MFLDLFYGLRKEGVPVGLQEWTMLMRALEKGLAFTAPTTRRPAYTNTRRRT